MCASADAFTIVSSPPPAIAVTGTMTVSYSKCAVENALRASAILVPVKQRSWAEMY